ncbi:DIS3-like exonuclease 2 [Planococcus citri]|uniref:DIS3-like exonuclease 2 n=1 Tax=Planococcus citri TaxID=170843 RepID=UPI0031F80414
MLPTSSMLKAAKNAANNNEAHVSVPFVTSNNGNRPQSKVYRSQHNSVKNQATIRTSTPTRNRSKSSSVSDKNTIRLIDFEDLTSTRASSETLSTCTINSNYSQPNFKTSWRRSLSNSNHFDDLPAPSTSINSLVITNSRLIQDSSQNHCLSGGIPSTSTNSLVITNSRLASEINYNRSLSSITFNDEIRVALPANVALQDVRECPSYHVAHLLRITREKNIQLKKKRKRTKKLKDEPVPAQRSVKTTNQNVHQLPTNDAVPNTSKSTSTNQQPTDSSTPASSSSTTTPFKKFSPDDLLKLRDPSKVEEADLKERLKDLRLYVDRIQPPSFRSFQPQKKPTLENISIAPDTKIKEYLQSSWNDLDDDVEERTSREIYEKLRKLADNFEEERPDLKSNEITPEKKSKKKKKWKNEANESRTKSQSESESNLPFEKFYTEDQALKGLQEGTLFKEVIRINQRNYKEAYISMDDGRDIFIDGVYDRNRALDGDEVFVALHPEEKWKVHNDESVQKCGKVVYISKRNHPGTAVGHLKITFKRNKIDKFILCPRDSRLPRIKIPVNLCPPNMKKDPKQYENILYEAKIIKWDTVNFAEGILIQELGQQNDTETETKCILLENHLAVEHIENYQQYLPSIDEAVSENEFENRLDLRTQCIFSIDPIGAKDLDDALSCTELPNGNFEVGVHIADVSYYLTPDTPLDINVREKATSVYLVQKVFHMLPNELCSYCSLTPGADKLAFSLFVEFNKDAQIVDHRFSRSVIRSCSQFTYQNAQEIMDKDFDELDPANFPPIENGFTLNDCAETITSLQFLARKLRKRRFDEGALKIDQPKIVFSFDDNQVPSSYSLFVPKESNWLIEEFMLIANILTANRIREKYPDLALLRLHSSPLEKSLSTVIDNLEKIGIYIDISNAGSIYHSMMRYEGCDEIGIARMAVIVNLLVKPMLKAKYVCSSSETEDDAKYWHYALNVPFYTHFTSPIRRYADIVVHRLLASSLGYCELPKWSSVDVQSIADNCNRKKNDSKRASEASADLYLRLYLEKHGPMQVRAVVIEVKERFFEVVDLSTRKANRVYVDKIRPAQVKFENNEGTNSLLVTWNGDGVNPTIDQIIQMFTIINIQMAYNKPLNKLTVTLLKPSS